MNPKSEFPLRFLSLGFLSRAFNPYVPEKLNKVFCLGRLFLHEEILWLVKSSWHKGRNIVVC